MFSTSPMGSSPNPQHSEEFLDLSWDLFGELSRALAFKVARDFRPDIVVGIAKAGVIPGAVIASILRVDFYSLTISRREGEEVVRDRPAVLSAAPARARGCKVLLVDEITTSGDTLRLGLAAVRNVGPKEVRTATCFARPQGFAPDYSALVTDQTLIFPWDRKVFSDSRLVVNPRYEGVIED